MVKTLKKKKKVAAKWQKVTDQQIIDLLHENNGLICDGARKLGVSRNAIVERINRNPEMKQLREDYLEYRLDIAENKLFEAIKDAKSANKGDITAIVFFLKTKGRHRGYAQDELTKENLSAVRLFLDMQRDPPVCPSNSTVLT